MTKSLRILSNNFSETVIEVVRLIVAADRHAGMKTTASLEIRAPELQEKPRKLRQLFERDRIGFIGAETCDRYLLRGAEVMERIAQRHLELARHADEQAAQFRQRRISLNLSNNGDREWGHGNGYGASNQRRAA